MDRRVTAVLLAFATSAGLATGAAAATPSPHTSPLWQENLAQPASSTNIDHSAGRLRIANRGMHPAAQAGAPGYGLEVLAPHTLSTLVNRVAAIPTDTVPHGAKVTADVRGQRPDRRWTEWTPSTGTLSSPASVVPVRITLQDNASGQSPTVRDLKPAASRTTREGLVGGTTANGHVIVDNDHFVALPSGSALSDEGSDDYSVQVRGPSSCETAPVWDIGPWNIHDDYWDADRGEFTDLDQGTPEAQAAYDDGYNGGYDDLGGMPSNPACIDLADGTFYDVGLDDNGYVTVTCLWT